MGEHCNFFVRGKVIAQMKKEDYIVHVASQLTTRKSKLSMQAATVQRKKEVTVNTLQHCCSNYLIIENLN